MAATLQLPLPNLNARLFGARCIPALTDDNLYAQTGVRIALTGREGGVSEGPYAALNLGTHVGDNPAAVAANRVFLLEALDAANGELVVPNQVHGTNVVHISSNDPEKITSLRRSAEEGADALLVSATNVAAMLCYADCVPVIIVSPSGNFAVVHAGWRGVVGNIVPKALRLLVQADEQAGFHTDPSELNVYIGPHIHVECFETGPEVRQRFADEFGEACIADNIADKTHVDLFKALMIGCERVGVVPQRVASAGFCTVCEQQRYFSYRASGGICGRHGAIALRKPGENRGI